MSARNRSRCERYVRVECRLSTPIGGLQAPYLDAVLELEYAKIARTIMESSNGHRHQYHVQPRGMPVPVDGVGKLPIPIIRTEVNGLPIARCSSPICADALTDEAANYTTAFPLDKASHLLESERTKIMQSGGRFKSFRLPLRVRLIDRIVWFAAIRTPPSELLRRLARVHSLGKKTSQGWGCVSGWSVDTIDADWSWYADSPDGPVLMRPLPADMDHPEGLIGARRSFGGVVAPYWQRDLWREMVEPC